MAYSKIISDIAVAGTSYRQVELREYLKFGKRHVVLKRENLNPYDKNATAVYAPIGSSYYKVGYIPRDWAGNFAYFIDSKRYKIKVINTKMVGGGEKNLGLRISISIEEIMLKEKMLTYENLYFERKSEIPDSYYDAMYNDYLAEQDGMCMAAPY